MATDGGRDGWVFQRRLALGAQLDCDELRVEQRQSQPGRAALGPKQYFPGSGQLFAIDSVSGSAVTLRRLHKDLNVGQPPAPAAGLSGVTFTINTLDPQIEEASFDIKRRFGIDENIVYRDSSWIYDQRDLRMATVLTVLLARYTQEARTDKGDWARKISLIRTELEIVLDRVQVRWGPLGNSAEPTTLFSCKISR